MLLVDERCLQPDLCRGFHRAILSSAFPFSCSPVLYCRNDRRSRAMSRSQAPSVAVKKTGLRARVRRSTSCLPVKACELLRGGRILIRRQRDRGTEDVARIVAPLDHGQPFGVGTKACGRAVRLARSQQIRISAGKGDRLEAPPRVAQPVLMPPLFHLVRPFWERVEEF